MFEKLITVFLQLFCSFLVVSGIFQTYNVDQNNGPLGKITIDKRSGYLYVGGNNILLQLYSNLSVISEVAVGPILDNSMCYPLPAPCSYQRELTDNKIHVLAINEPKEYILACGTANHGLCSAYSLSDIGAMNKTLNPMKATNNIVGSVSGSSYSNSYAFFGSTHSKLESSDNRLLYVAMGTANQSLQFTPAIISSREVKYSSNPWNMDYFLNSTTSSSFMNVDPSLQYKFRSYYIYGFENSGYTYFISVQMNDPTAFEVENNKFVTKIIKICQDDTKYSSYTELPIECNHGDKTYHIATSAILSDYGYLPFEKYLYITFGKQDELNPSPDKSQGSVLCTFDFNKITELFEQLQKDCFTSGLGNEVAWFVGKSLTEARSCARDTGQDLSNFCGGKKNLNGIQESTNLDVRSRQTLKYSAIYHEAKSILSTVNVIQQNVQNIAVLGTDEGYLMKVLVKKAAASLPSPYMTYDITKDRKVKIEPGSQTDSSGTSVYLLSNTQVTKFPLDACEVHTTCEQCVGVDPLGCGWCGNKCTSQQSCSSEWSGQSCPPIINKISPISGPTNGGTLLTLEGQNFGTMFAEVREITIGKDICQVTTTTITSTKITCTTQKMTVEGEGQVKVIVNDSNNRPYQINGEYTSPDLIFSYKSPEVLDFTPKYGPLSGGTKLVISGKNLNVGAKHSVQVAGQKCVIEPSGGIQGTSLTCLTPKLVYSKRRRKRETNSPSPVYDVSIRLDIDGFTYQFNKSYRFMEDSTVTSIGPHKSIQGGGTTVTVTGTNLHIISEPMIIAKSEVNGNNKQTVPVACYNSSRDGTTLLCPAPSIKDVLETNLPCCGYKSFYLSFIMDGIQSVKQLPQSMSYMQYFLNPVFLPFTEDDHIRYFLITEERLEIKGEHLHYGVTTKDVTVTIGNSVCEVTVMRAAVLYCTPKDKPSSVGDNEPRRTVEVKVGYMTYDIGELIYKQEIASAMSPGIIAMAVILALVVLCIIVLVYILKRNEIGPFKQSPDKHGVQYAAGREVAFTGLDSAGQRVFDMENAQNETTKIKVSEKISDVKIKVTDDIDSLSENKAYAEQRMSGELPNGAEGRSPILLDDDTLLVLKDKNLLIEREWLTLGEIIGKGHFGCVYRGYLEVPNVKGSQLVAVKTLHQDDPRQLDVDSFIEEALRMKDFHNPNVLTLTGICFGMDDMPLVILPFMTHGDLLSYIRKEENNPTIKDLILFGIDIARGMEYLSGCKFVHRDLAARNCMLDENFRAVVGDFGLSRDIYAKDYYASENKKTKLPVKWMAPECLEKGHYSSQSDVWSFGVVLWELMTRGVNPYPEVDNWDVLRYIKKGRRMPQPPFCPDILYKMMSKCWSFNPNDRPKFSELVHEINEMINVLEQQMKQGQHTTDIQSTYVNTETCTDYHYHDNKHPDEETEAMA